MYVRCARRRRHLRSASGVRRAVRRAVRPAPRLRPAPPSEPGLALPPLDQASHRLRHVLRRAGEGEPHAPLADPGPLLLEVHARRHRHARVLQQRIAHAERVCHPEPSQVGVQVKSALRRRVLVRLHAHTLQAGDDDGAVVLVPLHVLRQLRRRLLAEGGDGRALADGRSGDVHVLVEGVDARVEMVWRDQPAEPPARHAVGLSGEGPVLVTLLLSSPLFSSLLSGSGLVLVTPLLSSPLSSPLLPRLR
mmetsp:Transcript_39817/g.128021  ORF Transcript_39817/g.128021 Transcript_39817/m.128021 type:complete len:249 (+) Transcript_39817:269-1015(+)